MSGIDLWDDEPLTAQPDAAALPMRIHLIADADETGRWADGLSQYGIELCATPGNDCQLILVDERCADYGERLTAWPADAARPPLFFLLGEGAEQDCMRAFSWGADDYVHLPISAEALALRLKRVESQLRDTSTMRSQLSQSSQIAFQSMTLNAELGRILQYMEYSFACKDFAELARLTLEAFNAFGLHASLGIFHDHGMDFFFDDNQHRPIEQEVLENARHLGRISDFATRTILNYPHVAVLIRNMPLDDPLRYGILKDHICYIANGLEARSLAMINELRSSERAQRIQATASVLQQMIREMEQSRLQVTQRSTDELQSMIDTLHTEFSQLCLTAPEEERLLGLLGESSDRIHSLFRSTREQDQQFQQLLYSVAQTLER